MAKYGNVTEFHGETDSWDSYYERLGLFCRLNTVPAGEAQVDLFLTSCGTSTYELLVDLCSPDLPHTKSLQQLNEIMSAHFTPTKLQPAERFRFTQCVQQSGQTFAQYMAALRKAASKCGFGDALADRLRDQFISGIKSEAVRRRLLAEAELDLSKAQEIAQSMEAAETSLKVFSKPSSVAVDKLQANSPYKKSNRQQFQPRQQHQPQQPSQEQQRQQSRSQNFARKPPGSQSQCGRCLRFTHRADNCPYRESICHGCQRKGHLKRACRSRPNQPRLRPNARTHAVDAAECESELSQMSIGRITAVNHVPSSDPTGETPKMVPLQLNGHKAQLELDTGSAKTLVNEATWSNLLGKPRLTRPNVSLVSYTGHTVSVKGQCELTVQYGSQTATLTAYVTKGQTPNLLGREWLHHIKLDWHALFPVRSVQPQSLASILAQYEELFQPGLGKIKGITAKIQLREGAKPRFSKARPVPYSLRKLVEEELARLVALDVLEPISHSDWSAPIVPILKKDATSVRTCGDYRASVNPAMLIEQYPLPKPSELFNRLSGGKRFSKLDLAEAYLQLCVDPESQKLLAINTHKGLFACKRLQYGISSAPGLFQKAMEEILQGLIGVSVYLDDVTVSGKTDAEHLDNLQKVLQRFKEYGIRLRREKCSFFQESIEYLGFILDGSGVRPSPAKVKAVVKMPSPTNVPEVRAFLGMVQHYRPFLQNLFDMAAPITQLTQKDVPWVWGEKQQKAFAATKGALTGMGVLTHFDPKVPLTLACDASSVGLGAVLCHLMPDGSERPIAYASKRMTQCESRYSQIEKEGLSIIFGIKKFHAFLYGNPFTLITDHRPLVSIFSPDRGLPSTAISRLQRWALLLNAYSYTIRYRPTGQHGSADGLSRLTSGSDPDFEAEQSSEFAVNALQVLQIEQLPVTAKQVQSASQSDRVISKVIGFVLHGWPSSNDEPELAPFFRKQQELTVQDGMLLWNYRVVVPEPLQAALLDELHATHVGIVAMKNTARSHFWWPGIDGQIETVAHQCVECALKANAPAKSPVQAWPYPQQPWVRLHADFCGPVLGSQFLVLIDAHSKWCELVDMRQGTTAAHTIAALRNIFAAQGLCREICTDNGPPFQSQEFEDFCRINGILHKLSAPYHPPSNGEAERMVGVFKAAMRPFENLRGTAKDRAIANFLLTYRTTVHSTTNATPSQLLNKRQLRTRLDLVHPDPNAAALANQQKMVENKQSSTKPRSFRVNDPIWARDFMHNTWAPGHVTAVLGSRNYEVAVKSRSGERVLTWKRHLDQLRVRYPKPEPTTPGPPVPAAVEPPSVASPPDNQPEVQTSPKRPKAAPPTKQYPIRSRASNVNRLIYFNFILCAVIASFGFIVAANPPAVTTASTTTTTTTTSKPSTAMIQSAVTRILPPLPDLEFLKAKAEELGRDYQSLQSILIELEAADTLSPIRLKALQRQYEYLSVRLNLAAPTTSTPTTTEPTSAATTTAPAPAPKTIAPTTTALILSSSVASTTVPTTGLATNWLSWLTSFSDCGKVYYWLMAITFLLVSVLILLICKFCRSECSKCCHWQIRIIRSPSQQPNPTETPLLQIPHRRAR